MTEIRSQKECSPGTGESMENQNESESLVT
jgi:hypothetical protein